MPKKLLWFIGAAVVVILLIALYAGSYPGRVALLNESGRAIHDVTVSSGRSSVTIETLRGGETRVATLPSGEHVVLTFRGQKERRWESLEPLRPGESMTLYITAEERVDSRKRRWRG